MKNGRKEMDNADQADGRKGNKSDQHLCTINFDLKNVKLKIPKVPFTVHGRLMVKDDFFPSVVATFELPISKAHLQDLRESAEKQAKQPEAVEVPLFLGVKVKHMSEKSLIGGKTMPPTPRDRPEHERFHVSPK